LNLWQTGRIAGLATATRKASVSLAEREGDEVVTASARLKVPLAVGSLPPTRARSVLPRKQEWPARDARKQARAERSEAQQKPMLE
jgi:hypothetical protein